MTYAKLLSREKRTPVKHSEHDIQAACIKWFRLQYPRYSLLLFAVPNGTNKSKTARMMFKAEGLTAGVSDLILFLPRGCYHGLCIEMKTRTGRQSAEQKAWQAAVEAQGYLYVIIRSLDEFIKTITNYNYGNKTKS